MLERAARVAAAALLPHAEYEAVPGPVLQTAARSRGASLLAAAAVEEPQAAELPAHASNRKRLRESARAVLMSPRATFFFNVVVVINVICVIIGVSIVISPLYRVDCNARCACVSCSSFLPRIARTVTQRGT